MSKERIVAKVTDVMTTDFAEVRVIDDTEQNAGFDVAENKKGERYIAQFDKKKLNVRRGDIVEIVPLASRTMTEARIAYIGPLLCFIVGFLVSKNLEIGERILSGAILAVMAFVISWLMNRRARMLKRQEYKVVSIIEADPNHI